MNIVEYAATQAKADGTLHNLGPAVMYTFGALFLLLGIACIFLFPKAKAKAENYKKEQLKEYKKQNPKSNKTYEQTGMFLPPWERIKQFAPAFFAVTFFILAFAFLLGQPLHLFTR